MEKQTLTFTLERETKNTIRYAEDASGKPQQPRKLTVALDSEDKVM
jgi:hypothetical protein